MKKKKKLSFIKIQSQMSLSSTNQTSQTRMKSLSCLHQTNRMTNQSSTMKKTRMTMSLIVIFSICFLCLYSDLISKQPLMTFAFSFSLWFLFQRVFILLRQKCFYLLEEVKKKHYHLFNIEKNWFTCFFCLCFCRIDHVSLTLSSSGLSRYYLI